MPTVLVRYRTKPDMGELNAELVRAVFAELHGASPAGLRYATFALEDGVSFVHVARVDAPENPLATNGAFAAFQAEIAERCDEPPVAMGAELIGNYGLLAD